MPSIEGFRLSPQQTRLWSLQRAGAASPYRARCAVSIAGAVDAARLCEAVGRTVERHEILRTVFRRVAGMSAPLQVITEAGAAVEEEDARGVDDAGLDARAAAFFQETGDAAEDADGSPLRARLLAVDEDRHLLLLDLPALCADLESLEKLTAEIARAYGAGGEALPDVAVQYADFAEWQNGLLEEADTAAAAEWWRSRDFAPLLPLPLLFDAAPAEGQDFDPRTLRPPIGGGTAGRVEALAAELEAPAEAILLACWHLLLRRLTGGAELVIGAAADGRRYPELREAVGLLARYLPVRLTPGDDAPFHEMAREVAAALEAGRARQEHFTWPDDGAAAFFPYLFEAVEAPVPHTAGGVTFALRDRAAHYDRFAAKLVCVISQGGIEIELHHDAAVLGAEEAARVAGYFAVLLDAAVADPGRAAGALDILPDAERARIEGLSRSDEAMEDGDLVPAWIEAAARRSPDAVAVVFEDEAVSYGELDARANRLARHLAGLGAGPDVPVGILVERSAELMVAVLAILKSGSAYLPLDPALPDERIGAMLDQARAPLVVTREHLAGRLAGHSARAVRLDADADAIGRESDAAPGIDLDPANLAYVIFTSGSTGQPKGVMVEHRQLAAYVRGASARMELPAGGSYATVSSLAADLGNTAVFPALCGGGTLHLVSAERAADPAAFAEYLRRHAVDCLKIVPSHLAALAGSDPAAVLPRRRLVLGGEAAAAEWVDTLRDAAPECEIFNHYGPTEATVGALVHRAGDGARTRSGTVPLGRPLPGARVHVLDPHLRPVPVGIAGELYLGGAGVARGYLHQPGQTADRFLPDPSGDAGARMYRTGDRARWLPDGTVEFLGRSDDQLKIRGFRVEPGEVEAALRIHPAVREAAVVARDGAGGAGEHRLVAYVGADGGAPQAAELRDHLRSRLPDYMVPSAFVVMPALPRLASGKVDRRALPAPEAAQGEPRREYAAPGTAVEQVLAALWEELLGVERVGLDDDFFVLGGHSLLATTLLFRIRETLQVQLPLRRVFDAPTLAELARQVVDAEAVPGQTETIAGIVMRIAEMSGDDIRSALGAAPEADVHAAR